MSAKPRTPVSWLSIAVSMACPARVSSKTRSAAERCELEAIQTAPAMTPTATTSRMRVRAKLDMFGGR